MPGPRRRKLPGSTVLAAIEFAPTAALWAAVSHHVKPLNEEARAELSRILGSYYVSFQFEQNAPEILVAEAQLKNIETAALTFAQAIWSRSEGNDAEREAAGNVESLLNSSLKLGHFSIYRGPWYGPHWVEVEGLLPYTREPTSEEWETRLAPISVARVSEIMTEFVVACDSAARELKQLEMGDFFALGGAWREMVERVATFYNARGYKATARNDRGVRTPPSDFTRLINTIQFQLPEKFRRHHRASTAEMAGTPLESAIAKVLAACKRERKRASTDMPIIES